MIRKPTNNELKLTSLETELTTDWDKLLRKQTYGNVRYDCQKLWFKRIFFNQVSAYKMNFLSTE